MQSTVRVKKTQAAYFRKLALAEAKKSGKEIQAYLVGHSGVAATRGDATRSTTRRSTPTRRHAVFAGTTMTTKASRRLAEAAGKHVIGDAHSHPEWDAVLSPTDYVSHIQEGYRIARNLFH